MTRGNCMRARIGAMLAVGYWCEDGCWGRIELREVFVSLHPEGPGLPDDVWLSEVDGYLAAPSVGIAAPPTG